MLSLPAILAPTDLSRHATAGLQMAAALAEKFGSTLHVLHVLPEIVAPVGPDPLLVADVPSEFYADAEARARESLAAAVRPEWGAPGAIVPAVRWGDPVGSVLAYAREIGVDLIVIATHGRSGLSHVLLGSVAERIVREAPCPVLTVREPMGP